ncbi:MAG TPA: chemotaxis protein CheW [Rhizobacter sp.]|nr:chemotaxis protein CheW [Rhizobacter sp.]
MDMYREGALIAQHEATRALLADASGEYLTFLLGGETYAIDIAKVQEIRDYTAPARLDKAPDFVKGTINLHGVPVPVIDLRLRLGCKAVKYNSRTAVIVLSLHGGLAAFVVDSVATVMDLSADRIKPAALGSEGSDTHFVIATGCLRGHTINLMDMNAVLDSRL